MPPHHTTHYSHLNELPTTPCPTFTTIIFVTQYCYCIDPLWFTSYFSHFAMSPTHFTPNDIDNNYNDVDDYNNHTKMLLPYIANTDDWWWWRRWLLAHMTQQQHTALSERSAIVNLRAGHLRHTWLHPIPPWTLNTSNYTSTDTSSHPYYQSSFYLFLYFIFLS